MNFLLSIELELEIEAGHFTVEFAWPFLLSPVLLILYVMCLLILLVDKMMMAVKMICVSCSAPFIAVHKAALGTWEHSAGMGKILD